MEIDMFLSPGLFRVIRVIRLGRLLRFFEAARGIRQLLFTILKSAPALSNVGTLLFLILFIYSVMGMSMFGRLKMQGSITPVVNFQTFGSSMCVLFRISTAAGWNGVLDGAMVQPPKCDPSLPFGNGITDGDCGNKWAAVTFFVSYILLIVLIIVNMYIAVILENFNQAQSQDDAGITEDDIEAYYDVWQLYDPKATQFMRYQDVSLFLDDLEPPFRIEAPNYWFLEKHEVPIKNGYKVHCLDLLMELVKNILGDDKCVESEHTFEIMKKVNAKYKVKFPQRFTDTVAVTTNHLKIERNAAQTIQRVWRWYLLNGHIESFANSTSHVPSIQLHRKFKQIETLLKTMLEAKRRRLDEERARAEEEKMKNENRIEETFSYDEIYDDDDAIVETTLL